MSWASEEMEKVNLGDKRLETRAVNLLNNLGSKPLETIPVACQGWAETKAAYRFFDNNKVTADKILAPHREATLKRMQAYPTILFIQDTTHLAMSLASPYHCRNSARNLSGSYRRLSLVS